MGEKTVVFYRLKTGGFWVLAARKIALRERCGIPVHIPNIKSCLQNFKATIKDSIIFHL